MCCMVVCVFVMCMCTGSVCVCVRLNYMCCGSLLSQLFITFLTVYTVLPCVWMCCMCVGLPGVMPSVVHMCVCVVVCLGAPLVGYVCSLLLWGAVCWSSCYSVAVVVPAIIIVVIECISRPLPTSRHFPHNASSSIALDPSRAQDASGLRAGSLC